jgi:hypothetical protein
MGGSSNVQRIGWVRIPDTDQAAGGYGHIWRAAACAEIQRLALDAVEAGDRIRTRRLAAG